MVSEENETYENETYRILFQGDGYQVVGVEFREDGRPDYFRNIRGLKADTETELRILVGKIYKGVKNNPCLIAHYVKYFDDFNELNTQPTLEDDEEKDDGI